MKIEFISYSGEWPSLCLGTAIYNIDGKEVKFGHMEENSSFWRSGGHVWFDGDDDWNGEWVVESGKWELDDFYLKDEYKPYAEELIDLFNENVPYGCCGGCI